MSAAAADIVEVDLGGAALLPGFVDAPCHLLLYVPRESGLDLGGLPALE